MNPTDQARKEARRKELKKNKKQRQLVRTAVIKGKNPTDIILELEKLDDMEFNVLAPPPLNDKVMKEKRRKLMETWHRVVHLYEKEEVDKHLDLRKMWNNYMTRKEEVMDHFDAVKTAQLVDVDDIPLPGGGADADGTGDIPLPPKMQPKGGILKKSSILDSLRPKTCPGVPAGPPPLLSDYIDFEDIEEPKSKRIRFAATDDKDIEESTTAESAAKVDDTQRKMLKMSGQDVDAYMKEMEEVHKKTEAEKAADLQNRMTARLESSQPGPPGEAGQQQFVQMTATPAGFMVRPHLRPGMPPPGVRLPPGPPPGRPQLPPGPPPGRPPFMGPGGPRPRHGGPHMQRGGPNPQVVSAGPQLNAGQAAPPKIVKTGSVIEAKPQMRNLLSDVTRFVPTNVKVKRDGQPLMAPSQVKKKQSDPMREVFAKHHAVAEQQPQVNKDDAYAQFMAEMEKMN